MQIHNPIVKAYTKYAENYDLAVKLYPLLGLKIEKYRDMTVNALNLEQGDIVIELGCGTGLNFERILKKIGPEGKLIGVDVTEKMLMEAKKRIRNNSWNNVELIHCDIAEYQFPKEIDGIFATGALQYSPKHELIVKRGYDALKHGRIFALLDFKKSDRIARIFTPLLLFFTGPFLANEEYIQRKAWKSIEKYFEKTTFHEGWGGFVYLSVGTKT